MNRIFIPAALAGLLSLAGCQTAPVAAPGASRAPAAPLSAQPVAGAAHYRVDATHSEVEFLVYKAGALAGLVGHDHTVEAQEFTGDIYLAPVFTASSFSLTLPVKQFVVDRPEARAAEGPDFDTQPSPEAVQGTLANMLGALELDAEHYPEVRIDGVKLTGPAWEPDLTVRISLHGVQRDLTLPVTIEQQGDTLSASGAFEIRQSDFGIKPLSILGGGIQVADVVRVRFHIVAVKT